MYSKEESAATTRKFWTTFGLYMKPVPSCWHPKINWLNYKTGIKDVYFRMHADTKLVRISIELTHGDPMIRQIYFEHFNAMSNMLHEAVGEEWNWIPLDYNEFKTPKAFIYKEVSGTNIIDERCWPMMISFFKPRLIALDEFWGDVKESMEGW